MKWSKNEAENELKMTTMNNLIECSLLFLMQMVMPFVQIAEHEFLCVKETGIVCGRKS